MKIETIIENNLGPEIANGAHAFMLAQIWAAEFVRARAQLGSSPALDASRWVENAAFQADMTARQYCELAHPGEPCPCEGSD